MMFTEYQCAMGFPLRDLSTLIHLVLSTAMFTNTALSLLEVKHYRALLY